MLIQLNIYGPPVIGYRGLSSVPVWSLHFDDQVLD